MERRYRRWHSFSLQSVYELDPVWHTVLDQVVWSCYAKCYANRECQRNFRYGKRANRECTDCPILRSAPLTNLLGEEFREGWLRIVDRTRNFYLRKLQIRTEFGLDRDIFKLRVHHQEIINSARAKSAVIDDKGEEVVEPLKEGSGTVLDLWRTLLGHIEERGGL